MVVLLAIAFVLSVIKRASACARLGLRCCCKLPWWHHALFSPGKMGSRAGGIRVHKVMSYSDAGSAFIFGSLVVPKWMFCLMAQALSSPFAYSGNYFRHSAHQPAVLHWRDGLLIRILGSIFQKALNISKIDLLSQSPLFSSGKMRSQRS